MAQGDKTNKVLKGLTAAFIAATFGVAGVSVFGLSDQKGAEKVLSDDGRFSIVEYTGHNFMGCGRGDLWRDEFKVKNNSGKETNVVVCQGIFKGGTVRIL